MTRKLPDHLEGFNPFGDYIGLEFTKVGNGHSQCTLEITENLLNPHRDIHGAAIFMMADSGMGAALITSIGSDELCSTIETKIIYFKAVASGALVCDTRIIHKGKRIAALESEIKHDGRLIAKALGTWSIYKEKRQ
jgi:acyl-CoA thioesterase